MPVDDEASLSVDEVAISNDLVEDNTEAEPFDFDGHLSAITTHRLKRQTPAKKRYILFILDSSGSVRVNNFNATKNVLSDILPLFCGNTLFAVMSYGAKLERNICFNCNQGNTFTERAQFGAALRSIVYHRGRYTRSGDAIRCACDYMLSPTCGYESGADAITDVIFLTDGHSNRGEDVCFATTCIPDDVNVISIGIGNNLDYDELKCIEGDNKPGSHIFDVQDFDGLVALKDSVFDYLSDPSNNAICRPITK